MGTEWLWQEPLVPEQFMNKWVAGLLSHNVCGAQRE